MKLYFFPAACSLAPHIALREAGLTFDLVKVDLATHQLENGTDYFTVNPKGPVPLLELDNGERISEVAAILQYIADQAPEKKLAPPNGTLTRTRLQETLSFIGSEIHKSTGALFHPKIDDTTKAMFKERLRGFHELMNRQLGSTGWCVGDEFTVADAYLFVMLNLANFVQLDMTGLDAVADFVMRMQGRSSVQAALKAEGLLG